MHRAALLPWLFASSAFAQLLPPIQTDVVHAGDIRTAAALNLYVATTGNDANSCTSASTPCLTIQGALAKVPKQINHAVTVAVGTGNFAGAIIEGFSLSTNGYLALVGTYSTFTPATGLSSGTLTSATDGDDFSTDWATATKTLAGWTANNLRGKWIRITGGTGSGQRRVIASNTATVITIPGAWMTTPDNTSTFAIEDLGTTINSNTTVPATYGSTTTTTAGFALLNGGSATRSVDAPAGSRITIHGFSFTNSATRTIFIMGGSVTVRGNRFSGAVFDIATDSAYVNVDFNNNHFANSGSSQIMSPIGGGYFSFAQNVVTSGGYGWVTAASPGVYVGSYGNLYFGLTNSLWEITNPDNNTIEHFGGDIVDCNNGGGSGARTASGGSHFGSGRLIIAYTTIRNCANAVHVIGPMVVNLIGVDGAGNTVGISASKGAHVAVDSDVTLTGTTEISIDGASSSLATMRAASPRHLKNSNYFTVIYE